MNTFAALLLLAFSQEEFPAGVYPGQPAFRETIGEDVTVWTTQGCMPCVMMKQVVGSGDGFTRVRYVQGTPPTGVPQSFPVATWTDSTGLTRYLSGYHTLAQLSSSIANTEETIKPKAFAQSAAPAESSPTPYAEVIRVLDLLPKPDVGFVDFGCGSEARWCIVAAEKWGCKATGVEIDHYRALTERERVKASGLEHLVTIIEGDAVTTDVDADVFAVYLYDSVLSKLQPKLSRMKAGASYMHAIPGMPATKNGDTFIYSRPVATSVSSGAKPVLWHGNYYYGRVCGDSRCKMCSEIQALQNSQR